MNTKILIVDDEENIRYILSCLLEEKGYVVKTARNGKEALPLHEKWSPDIILLDLEMPVMGGMDALKQLTAKKTDSKIIIITAYGTIPSAVEAMRVGAYDYISKPFNSDEILLVIRKAVQHGQIEKELIEARSRLDEKFSVKGIITINPEMSRLLEILKKIAPSDNSVLITGESGTGKELIANAVHQHSLRKHKPFVALNCGAFPETLVESELYGFKKGSFSGADYTKPGLVDKANGGTLFLDEIGEMSPDAQVKLLRFAESGEFIPIGSTSAKKVDVRIIAASNKNLESAVSEGQFRADLYYRLNVVTLKIPPLKERKEDIPVLTEHFVAKHMSADADENIRFTAGALKKLLDYDWPGNVRELENVVKFSLAMTDSSFVDEDSLPALSEHISSRKADAGSDADLKGLISSKQQSLQKQTIIETLRQCDGNKSKTARLLGICRNTLKKRMKLYNID